VRGAAGTGGHVCGVPGVEGLGIRSGLACGRASGLCRPVFAEVRCIDTGHAQPSQGSLDLVLRAVEGCSATFVPCHMHG
jgi:hypothetical protein